MNQVLFLTDKIGKKMKKIVLLILGFLIAVGAMYLTGATPV